MRQRTAFLAVFLTSLDDPLTSVMASACRRFDSACYLMALQDICGWFFGKTANECATIIGQSISSNLTIALDYIHRMEYNMF